MGTAFATTPSAFGANLSGPSRVSNGGSTCAG